MVTEYSERTAPANDLEGDVLLRIAENNLYVFVACELMEDGDLALSVKTNVQNIGIVRSILIKTLASLPGGE